MYKKTLKKRALELLSRRDYSRRELMEKLSHYEKDTYTLTQLLDELASNGDQSDRRFAETYVRNQRRKYGHLRLKQVLRQKGVDNTTITKVLHDCDDEHNAYEIWQKKFGQHATSPQEKARQFRFLIARGFSQDIVQRIVPWAETEVTPLSLRQPIDTFSCDDVSPENDNGEPPQ